ncbi:alpha/beta fold hydrolase [Parafrankia discariae]|uniref:alpha/beta fold hydrolase n=1 Tax=Parafrankia discariae TaxID=365528 RepID=UPI00227F6491|nr:alpha/beta hydrolase [Parafrankia discariae]
MDLPDPHPFRHTTDHQPDSQASAGPDPARPHNGQTFTDAALARITAPTLVVNGRRDIMIPTINSYLLAQHLPNAQLIVYPDSGHGSIFQYPDLFVSQAARFLDADQPFS